MGTVTIGSTDYTIYGSFTDATDYLAASLTASAWAGATTDQQKQALVSATRKLDALEWASGYETFAERDAVEAIQQASYEWAAQLLADVSPGAQAGNVKSVSSKGVSVEFFSPVAPGALPTVVIDLLVDYMASTTGGHATPIAGGACEETVFECSGQDPGKFDLTDAVG